MAYDSKYQKAIDKMILDTNVKMDEAVGWTKVKAPQVATAEAMKLFAFSSNPWNPLFYDEVYAAGTRWGGLIGYPMYSPGSGNNVRPVDSPDCGFNYLDWIGQDMDFYRPIRSGDMIKVWNRRPQMVEKTKKGIKGPRVFGVLEGDYDQINQRDEIISTTKQICYRTFASEPPEPYKMPRYQYTDAELAYMEKFMRAEEIRGGKTLYWEDVKIGDEVAPVVLAPTSFSVNVIGGGTGFRMGGAIPPRELLHEGARKYADFVRDPATGLYESDGGGEAGQHWSDLKAQARGVPGAFLYAVVSIYTMVRMITNFAGDDGFVRRYKWRHLFRTLVGDASIGHGRVIDKRIENGEHLVDLKVWLEMVRGIISVASVSSISLPSREAGYQWK